MEAIVLAGGFGTRLSTVVSDVPKPMAPINDRPFLEYLLEDLNEKGINRVILAVGYKKEIIKSYFKEKYKNIDIIYSDEDIPLGTGGAIKKALTLAENENIFIINGDTFFDVNLKEMYQFHKKNSSKLTLAIKEMEKFDRYGSLVLDKDKIIKFEEKKYNEKGYINGGIYLINKELLIEEKKENFSFEKEILENKNLKIKKYGYKSEGYFIDIGIPEDYYKYIELRAPKISVIVPIYNRENYLEKCLQSIISQDFRDIEIICINDGSVDKSLKILEKYKKKDERIIILNQKNNGVSSARNNGIKKAKGKYILCIDSDDWIEQGYFREIYNRAERDNLDITISDIIFDYNNKSLKIIQDLKISDLEVMDSFEYIKKLFTENFLAYNWNKLIKREILINNNIFYNENMKLFEDADLLLRVIKFSSKIGKLNKAYYHYIFGEQNGSCNQLKLYHLQNTIDFFYKAIEIYSNDDELVELIQRKKNLRLVLMFLGNKFDQYKEYDVLLEQYLKDIKKEKFILKKYSDPLNDESILRIFLYNFIKIVSQKEKFLLIKKIIYYFRKI